MICLFVVCAFDQKSENYPPSNQTQVQAQELALMHFYKLLFNPNTSYNDLASVYWNPEKDTTLLTKLKLLKANLTADTTLSAIQNAVRSAKWTDQGLQFGVYAAVQLNSKEIIHFELTKDTPTYIEYIWLADGTLLEDRLKKKPNPRVLLLVGAIADKDGFVNIRNAPQQSAKVIGTMPTGTFVYYSPNSQSPWAKVFSNDAQDQFVGYIHTSRIRPFERLTAQQQMEIRRLRNRD